MRFYVLFYPFREEPLIPQLCRHLKALDVPYFDYRHLLDSTGKPLFFSDGHPFPSTQEAVAQQLAKELP